MIRFRCLWLLAWRASSSCLPETTEGYVPVAERKNVTIDGYTLPIGFTNPNWESAIIYNTVASILIEEIIGFRTKLGPFSSSSPGTFDILANDPTVHVAQELWDYALTAYAASFNAANPDKALDRVKALDYSGTDGMYIFPKSYEPYYTASGKSLEFYKDLNVSWGNYQNYFSPMSVFTDPSAFEDCSHPNVASDGVMDDYITFTGDVDAIVTVNGQRKWICYQEKWWMSPACRDAPMTCAPMITNSFWSYNPSRQKAAVYNIAMSIANTIAYSDYTSMPKDHRTFSYWWSPDITFKADGAVKVIFLPYREDEYAIGKLTTDVNDVPLLSYVHKQLGTAAPAVLSMLGEMAIYKPDVDWLLEEVVLGRTLGVADAQYAAACQWVKDNQVRWKQWIPIATSCKRTQGYGMVTEFGEFVSTRLPDAAGCALCVPGRFADAYSDDDGNSAICNTCPQGAAQDRGAQTACTECEAGTYSLPTGTRCDRCRRGTYQPNISQTSCLSCLEPQTTSTVGSTSQEACICPAGTYRPCHDFDDGGALRPECGCDTSLYVPASSVGQRCLPCPEGMECPEGSDEQFFPCSDQEILNSTAFSYPVPQEGYFVEWNEPLWVFKCIDLDSCPGGRASNCGEGLQGAACGACAAGFYKQAGTCYKCGEMEKHPLFLIIPLLLSPVAIFVLYKVSQDDVGKWGKTTQGFGGIGYLLLVYVQSISVIMAVFPTVPAMLSAGLSWSGASAEITSLFRIECAGPSSFTENFLFNLFLPEIVGLVFFLTWLSARFIPKIRMDGDIVLGCFGGILKTFFVTVASKCFSLFQCYSHPNGMRSMRSSPEVLEHSDVWLSMVGFSAFAIGLNCLTVLVVFGWAMWVAPARFHLVSFRRRWKFMIQKMRPSVHWWMMVILIKGLWLALTSVLWNTTMSQSLWICTGLLAYFTGSYVLLPWRSVFVAMLDIGTHVSILLLCLLLPFLLTFKPEESDVASMFFLILAGLSFLAVVTSLLWILYKAPGPWGGSAMASGSLLAGLRVARFRTFNGDPRRLNKWTVRVPALERKEAAMTDTELKKLGLLLLRLIACFSGQVLKVVQTLDIKKLEKSREGLTYLIDAVTAELRPRSLQQAKELYEAGTATGGFLARQPAETMGQFVLRRRARYRAMTGLNAELKLPDLILAEQLRNNAGLTPDQKCYGYAVEADGVHNVDDEPQHDLEYPDDEAYCYVCYVDEYEDSGGYEIGTFAEEHLAYLAYFAGKAARQKGHSGFQKPQLDLFQLDEKRAKLQALKHGLPAGSVGRSVSGHWSLVAENEIENVEDAAQLAELALPSTPTTTACGAKPDGVGYARAALTTTSLKSRVALWRGSGSGSFLKPSANFPHYKHATANLTTPTCGPADQRGRDPQRGASYLNDHVHLHRDQVLSMLDTYNELVRRRLDGVEGTVSSQRLHEALILAMLYDKHACEEPNREALKQYFEKRSVFNRSNAHLAFMALSNTNGYEETFKARSCVTRTRLAVVGASPEGWVLAIRLLYLETLEILENVMSKGSFLAVEEEKPRVMNKTQVAFQDIGMPMSSPIDINAGYNLFAPEGRRAVDYLIEKASQDFFNKRLVDAGTQAISGGWVHELEYIYNMVAFPADAEQEVGDSDDEDVAVNLDAIYTPEDFVLAVAEPVEMPPDYLQNAKNSTWR
ncbi:unnamed protein product [Symbiodinium sp. KB8]|nr:unnamed protein product [Symbiodinium sp. KB8]